MKWIFWQRIHRLHVYSTDDDGDGDDIIRSICTQRAKEQQQEQEKRRGGLWYILNGYYIRFVSIAFLCRARVLCLHWPSLSFFNLKICIQTKKKRSITSKRHINECDSHNNRKKKQNTREQFQRRNNIYIRCFISHLWMWNGKGIPLNFHC